jgi:ubiquinone/menaquinone biosynthesis C-methylase UbiE
VVPLPIRSGLRKALGSVRHQYHARTVFGRHASMIPPLELMHDGPVGYTEFKDNAHEFFNYYVGLCGLKQNESVLDIGSGIGRKTFLLTDYLSAEGRYEGLDIVKTGVDWCTDRITRKYPNFKFQLIDIYNETYNPQGKHKASEYKLPFDDGTFDLVLLGSVFTHMLPEDTENYLSEIARVMKDGGRSLISFFLLNDRSIKLIEAGKSSINLAVKIGPCRVADANAPELAIGYEEDWVIALYRKYNLEIKQPVQHGSWCGREKFLSYQDLVLASKT